MLKNKQSRRDFLRTVAISSAGMTALVSGIPVSAQDEPSSQQQGVTVVKVLINGSLLAEADALIEAQTFTIYLQDFNLQRDDVVARYEGVSRTDYDTKIRLQTAAGEIDNTVIWSGFFNLDSWAIDGVLEPIDNLMADAGVSLDEWIPQAQRLIRYEIDTNSWNKGPVWALPLWAHSGVAFLHYNEDALNAAGASFPEEDMTWEQVLEIAEMVRDEANGVWGIGYTPSGDNHRLDSELMYIGPFGGFPLNEDGTVCLLNSDESIEGYATYYDIQNVRKLAPQRADHDAFGGYSGGADSGVLPMYRNGSWGANWYSGRGENVNPTMSVTKAPTSFDGRANGRRGTIMGIDWYGVSANASNPAATFDVLYWLTNKEAGEFQIDAGALLAIPRHDVLNYEGFENNPVAKTNTEMLSEVDPTPIAANARTNEINNLLSQRFAPVDIGEQVPDKAWLDQLTDEIQEILDMPPLQEG